MKQGDIYDVFLDPVLGSEQRGRRPSIIISGNVVNSLINTVIIVPLTTKVKGLHGNLVLEATEKNGLKSKSEALSIHVRAIDKTRLKKKIGAISKEEIKVIFDSLNKIFQY